MARTILDEVLEVRPDLIEHQLCRMEENDADLGHYMAWLKSGAKVVPLKKQIVEK